MEAAVPVGPPCSPRDGGRAIVVSAAREP